MENEEQAGGSLFVAPSGRMYLYPYPAGRRRRCKSRSCQLAARLLFFIIPNLICGAVHRWFVAPRCVPVLLRLLLPWYTLINGAHITDINHSFSPSSWFPPIATLHVVHVRCTTRAAASRAGAIVRGSGRANVHPIRWHAPHQSDGIHPITDICALEGQQF